MGRHIPEEKKEIGPPIFALKREKEKKKGEGHEVAKLRKKRSPSPSLDQHPFYDDLRKRKRGVTMKLPSTERRETTWGGESGKGKRRAFAAPYCQCLPQEERKKRRKKKREKGKSGS